MVETKKEPKKKYDVWEIKDRATATEPVFFNEETEEVLGLHEAINKILNDLDVIKRSLE